MAIFRSVIFSEIRQKLANTVLYKRNSDGIMRGKPGKIKNPRTPDQLTQRAKMVLLVDLSRRFTPILQEGFRQKPANLSVANAFVRYNMPQVTVDENYVATIKNEDIVCTCGIINTPDVSATTSEGIIFITQTQQEADGTSMKDDVIYAGLYESVLKSARLVKIGERSKTGTVEWSLPKQWVIANVKIYAFAVSHSKRNTSPTLFVALS